MSVCVVAEYPWRAIKPITRAEPPGVIICTDTRLSRRDGRGVIQMYHPKQRGMSRNILVCFTSSHVAATVRALDKVARFCDVKRIGEALKEIHTKAGGATELIAVVWRKGLYAPTVLEVMPPDYRAKLATGIIGLGDPGVLSWFQENFEEDPSDRVMGDLSRTLEVIRGFSKHLNQPVNFPVPRFEIDQAALGVAAAFSEGIREAGGPTVGLPVQVTVVSGGLPRSLSVWSSEKNNPNKGETLTAAHKQLSVLRTRLSREPADPQKRSAVKLFP